MLDVSQFTINGGHAMPTRIRLSDIKRAVCAHFKITREEIEGPSRAQLFARPRMMAMALSRDLTRNSLPRIARDYGRRDHTTCLSAIRRIAELREREHRVDEDYSNIKWAICYCPSEVIGVGWRHPTNHAEAAE